MGTNSYMCGDHLRAARSLRGLATTALMVAAVVGPSPVAAQEVIFETAADMPALISPDPRPHDDRALRLAMQGNAERKSRIFYLGLSVSALWSPDFLFLQTDRYQLRTSLGFRSRGLTYGATDLVAFRNAIVGPAVMGEIGSRFQLELADEAWLFARSAVRLGADVTRVEPVELGREENEDSELITASILSPHLAVGGGWGPFQLSAELATYEILGESDLARHEELIGSEPFISLFLIGRLSRHVYLYLRTAPFDERRFLYTWGVTGVLNPHDP